jgi:Tfp pilus assembly protein PilO
MRFILPVILIGVGLVVFFLFSNPLFTDIEALRAEVASYNEAQDNAKALEEERDKLNYKEERMDPINLEKLQKLLPENIDNIRLILEIEQLALPYGMALKNVKYNTVPKEEKKSVTTSPSPEVVPVLGGGVVDEFLNKDYGGWDLEFTTSGSYNNFVNFTKDLEKNLRIVDVSAINFSSDVGSEAKPALSEVYQYTFKIKTYWLKN